METFARALGRAGGIVFLVQREQQMHSFTSKFWAGPVKEFQYSRDSPHGPRSLGGGVKTTRMMVAGDKGWEGSSSASGAGRAFWRWWVLSSALSVPLCILEGWAGGPWVLRSLPGAGKAQKASRLGQCFIRLSLPPNPQGHSRRCHFSSSLGHPSSADNVEG